MDLAVNNNDDRIRKIEDIIDIQKANGMFSVRQVAFDLPSDSDPKVSAGLARSLESGLTKIKSDGSEKKKLKNIRTARHKSPIPDVVSWPSDSDITVLRMKLCLGSDMKEVGNMVPGDGLHQPDGSSMVNLATLMLQSQSASKHSVNIEEYLLPLTSWEERDNSAQNKEQTAADTRSDTDMKQELGILETICSRSKDEKFSWNDSENNSVTSAKSKIARFLRLYFCPCCSCLYNIENHIGRDKQSSVYSTHPEEPSPIA